MQAQYEKLSKTEMEDSAQLSSSEAEELICQRVNKERECMRKGRGLCLLTTLLLVLLLPLLLSLSLNESKIAHAHSNHTNFLQSDTSVKPQAKDEGIVILHVGPHKTGTTFLQQQLVDLSPTLLTDGYGTPGGIIFGKFRGGQSTANVANCLDDKKNLQPNCSKTFASFESFLNVSFYNNKSVVLSAEDFDNPGLDRHRLLNFFCGRWNSIVIVVTYRRLYEWCHSLHFQLHRRSTSEFKGFSDWIATSGGNCSRLSGSLVRNRYQALIGDRNENISVSVLNSHSSLPLEEALFCQEIPHANVTCSLLMSNEKPLLPANVGHSLEFRRLAIAAKKVGVVGPEFSVDELTMQIERNKNAIDFGESRYNNPIWHCLGNDEEEELFQASLKEEVTMVPVWFEEEGGKDSLRRDYKDFVFKGNLCSLNVSFVLSNASLVADVLSVDGDTATRRRIE